MTIDQNHNKLPYETPEIRSLALIAEETMAVGCKLGASGSAFGGKFGCTTSNCFMDGS